ncbi:energy-coupling factor transporter ATP-binding protein EcfA2 [Phyllobacterium sp. 1468]|uniref:ORC-CDC6 family AAA ATPase n=1 Tax=Phyllobacterium sp. 1468 TaxID=2817759 RepID=UPI00285946B8|nr:hypothetical protein [Phyllobacterium sp. 1468]MDR6632584.1 energy-coupling factor transporter ATP-binding protein EcfA2 [Phyllobacterium sp. 1468]
MIDHTSALFDVYNARFLEPEKVGSNFVASPFLDQAAASVNAAILGPRGSGKTTLLKMLTLPALLRWDSPKKVGFAESLDYMAVYIPASITWSAEYRSFHAPKQDQESLSLLSISLFRHSVLLSLIDTWMEASNPTLLTDVALSRFHLPIEDAKEPAFARELARVWELELRASSVNGLREAVRDRVRLMQRLAVRCAYGVSTAADLLDDAPFLANHFLDDASAFCDFLERNYGFSFKLALCFDELEIAVDRVAEAVLQAPRSIDQRLLIKFSAAPFVGVAAGTRQPAMPTQQNDFKLVFLSSFSAKETRGFSEALFASVCHKHGVRDSVDDVLGNSFVDDAPADSTQTSDGPESIQGKKYAAAGNYHRKFLSLFERDPSFRDYVYRKSINITDLSTGSEKRRAADIRKIIWPVIVREEFLFDQERQHPSSKVRRRLRSKNAISDIYTGAGALFAICEGNPRWILGLLEPMVHAYQQSTSGNASVKRSIQRDSVERMTAAYFALLSTIPSSSEAQKIHSLVDLVDKIGMYFQGSVLGTTFNADPVLSFVVDERVPSPVRELIGKGINIGAFITTQAPRLGAYHVGELGGLKVRLANIFAPRFKLPLAGGRTIGLSTILGRSQEIENLTLLDLFGTKI